jgi:hypothetical protein
MDFTTTLDIPDPILAGLVKGDLVRRGGVIQWAAGTPHAGEIVMWLRETGTTPVTPNTLAPLFGQAGQLFAFAGSVASVINLGATVAFGVAIYAKVSRGEALLKELKVQMDQLQWAFELGYVTILNSMALVLEIELKARVQAAARLAWDAQQLAPGSLQRSQRLENALALATEAQQQLVNHTEHEMEAAIHGMAQPAPQQRLAIPNATVEALRRFRQTCIACCLRAAIQAETGNPTDAARSLEHDQLALEKRLYRLGKTFLHGAEPRSTADNTVYNELLDVSWAPVMPVQRIEMWARRFDPDVGGLSGVLEVARPNREAALGRGLEGIAYYRGESWWESTTSSGETLFGESVKRHREKLLAEQATQKAERQNLSTFVDLLDGAFEDVDRLAGYVAEYRTAGQQCPSLQHYRDSLALKELPDNRGVAFLLPAPAK